MFLATTSVTAANLEQRNKYLPYIELGATRYFNQNSKFAETCDLFLPLLQNYSKLIFTDLRIFDRSGSSLEGNAHLGFRKTHPDNHQIIGVYGAFDYRISEQKNGFSQITASIEYWNKNIFIGGNIYKPIGRTKKSIDTTKPSQTKVTITDKGFSWFETNEKFYEKALPGIDAELGFNY